MAPSAEMFPPDTGLGHRGPGSGNWVWSCNSGRQGPGNWVRMCIFCFGGQRLGAELGLPGVVLSARARAEAARDTAFGYDDNAASPLCIYDNTKEEGLREVVLVSRCGTGRYYVKKPELRVYYPRVQRRPARCR